MGNDLADWIDGAQRRYVNSLKPKPRAKRTLAEVIERASDSKPRKNLERDLQTALIKHIRDWFPVVIVWASANETSEAHGKTEEQRMRFFAARKRRGVLPGAPDLTLCLPRGRTLFFELKSPRGRLSPSQQDVHARMRSAGHTVHLIRHIDQAHDIIKREMERP